MTKVNGTTITKLCRCILLADGVLCMHYRTSAEWVNPGQYGLVLVTSSEGRNLPYGKLEDILTRDSTALNCHTNDDKYFIYWLICLCVHFSLQFSALALLLWHCCFGVRRASGL